MAKLKVDDNLLRVLLITLFIFIVYNFILLPLDFLLPLRLAVNDSVFNSLSHIKQPQKTIKDIVIVSIDERTLIATAKRWPWSRSFYADIIEKLSSYNPKVIGLDITFLGKSDNPKHDDRLRNAFNKAGNIILAGYITESGNYLIPYAPFLDVISGYGFVNKISDKDLKIRKARVVYQKPSFPKVYFSFELFILAHYLGIPPEKIMYEDDKIIVSRNVSSLLTKDLVIPVSDIGTVGIQYLPVQNIQSISLIDVLKDKDELNSFFKDKIVLLGQTSKTLHDIYQTPYGILAGVFINAFTLNTISKQMFICEVPKAVQMAIVFILVLLTAFLSYRLSLSKGLLFLCAELISILIMFGGMFLFCLRPDYFSILFLTIISFIGAIIYKYSYLLYSSNRLKRMVITDATTGLATPRYFQFKLQLDIAKVNDTKTGVSLVIFSVPKIQELLKTQTHEHIELILRQLSIILKQNSRKKVDLLTRWKEDKFAAILLRTGINDASLYSKKIISKIEETEFLLDEGTARLSANAGVSNYPTVKTKSALDLIACAEATSNRAIRKSEKVAIFNSQEDKIHIHVLQKESFATEEDYLTMDIAEREKELLQTLNDLKKSQQETQKAHFETILSLVKALEEKDPYTAGHSERVAKYAVGIAKEIGLDEGEIKLIRESALLHDTGKFGLPDKILHKKEKLTNEEIEQIRKHPVMGERILERSKFFEKHIPLLLHHHERYDGKGYPHGLSGKIIPRGAQILAIADAVDAMTTGRGYNHVLNIDETIEELKKSSGSHFDPDYVTPAVNFLTHSVKK